MNKYNQNRGNGDEQRTSCIEPMLRILIQFVSLYMCTTNCVVMLKKTMIWRPYQYQCACESFRGLWFIWQSCKHASFYGVKWYFVRNKNAVVSKIVIARIILFFVPFLSSIHWLKMFVSSFEMIWIQFVFCLLNHSKILVLIFAELKSIEFQTWDQSDVCFNGIWIVTIVKFHRCTRIHVYFAFQPICMKPMIVWKWSEANCIEKSRPDENRTWQQNVGAFWL